MFIDNQQVALVKGASRGLGPAVAKRLARDSFVVVSYSSGRSEADVIVREIAGAEDQAATVQADVAEFAPMHTLLDATENRFGGLDLLVNDADVMRLKPLVESNDAFFDCPVALNLKGWFNTMLEAVLRVRQSGRIIIFSSNELGRRLKTYGVHVATKSVAEGLTAVLSMAMRGRDVTVNAGAPEPMALFFDGQSNETIELPATMNPLERPGFIKDIAGVASFLAGLDEGCANGQLRANGGMV